MLAKLAPEWTKEFLKAAICAAASCISWIAANVLGRTTSLTSDSRSFFVAIDLLLKSNSVNNYFVFYNKAPGRIFIHFHSSNLPRVDSSNS